MRRRTALLPPLALAAALAVSAGAFAQAEAQRQLDAALDRVRAALGPDGQLTVGETSVNPVTGEALLRGVTLRRGERQARIGSLTLTGLAGDRIGGAVAQDLRFETGRGDGSPSGPDRTGGVRKEAGPTDGARPGTGPDGGSGSGPGATRIARAGLTGLRLPAPGAPWDWGALALEGGVLEGVEGDGPRGERITVGRVLVEGYAPGTLRAATLEGAALRRPLADGRTATGRIGRLTAAGVALPAPGMRFDPLVTQADSAEAEGLDLDDPEHGVVLALGRLRVRNWGENRDTGAELQGLSVAVAETPAGPLSMGLGRATMTDVPLRDTIAALFAGVTPARLPPGRRYGLEAQGLELNLAGSRLLGVGTLAASGGGNARSDRAGTEQAGALRIDGLTVVPPAGYGEGLREVGYDRFAGGLSVEGRIGEPEGLLNGALRLDGDGMGTLSSAFRLSGWPQPQPGATVDGEAMLGEMAAALLESLDLRWEDRSLAGRLIALAARRAGLPEAQMREQLARTVLDTPLPGPSAPARPGKAVRPARPGSTTADAPEVAAIRGALARFLRGQASVLEIAVRPPAPVPVSGLLTAEGEPAALVGRLGLTVTAR